jgi:tetratricopeptide (TPR) repeat protein
VKIVRKLLSHSRLRTARRRLVTDPSPMTYAGLAREHAWEGNSREALRVCEEGLASYPGNPELLRLAERTRRAQRENRLGELKRELREAPRRAVYLELCEVLLDSDQLLRAEECALEWFAATRDDDAKLMLARVCVERFLTDRGRDAGRRAFDVLDECEDCLARDPRTWTLRLGLASKIGAWEDAHRAAGMLLELTPGDPDLEGRFRRLAALKQDAPSVEQALREVERTGHLSDDVDRGSRRETVQRDVRPLLQSVAAESGVHAAVYLRGSTALVQGPRGATAERTARAVRRIAKTGRSAARRLGLGQVSSVSLEGNFGTIAVVTGDSDAGAIWCSGKLSRAREKMLLNLAGVDADTDEEAAE